VGELKHCDWTDTHGPEQLGQTKGDFPLKSFTADHHHQPLHRQRCSILLPALPKHGAPSSALQRAWPAFPKELATPKSQYLFWRLVHMSTISESRTILLSFATGIFSCFSSSRPFFISYRVLGSSALSHFRRKSSTAISMTPTIKTLSAVLVT
jgi:hypothetical protein